MIFDRMIIMIPIPTFGKSIELPKLKWRSAPPLFENSPINPLVSNRTAGIIWAFMNMHTISKNSTEINNIPMKEINLKLLAVQRKSPLR
jgi:hypothetical protein